jgi:hypothetical protein
MRVAVVGAGIFGVSAAVKLAREGHKVELYEKNDDILAAASGINQYRLHRGYHYPRSKSTALSSKYAEESFRREYGNAVLDHNEHYYVIAKDGSRVTGAEFVAFCKECELEHEEVDLSSHIHSPLIDLSVRGREALLDPVKLKSIASARLKEAKVKVKVKTIFLPYQVAEYDLVVNCSYANSNFILEQYPEARREYQFEVCEKPLFLLPPKYKGKSIVVMDGPFFCIDPYSTTDMHVMGNVVHAIHATNVGMFPIVPDEIKPFLDRGIVPAAEARSVSHVERFLEVAIRFMPDLKEAVHIGSMFTVRTVLPNVDKTDERPTLVSKVGDKIIHVFSGKLGNCVEAAETVAKLAR